VEVELPHRNYQEVVASFSYQHRKLVLQDWADTLHVLVEVCRYSYLKKGRLGDYGLSQIANCILGDRHLGLGRYIEEVEWELRMWGCCRMGFEELALLSVS
jgi:hypothetical protein